MSKSPDQALAIVVQNENLLRYLWPTSSLASFTQQGGYQPRKTDPNRDIGGCHDQFAGMLPRSHKTRAVESKILRIGEHSGLKFGNRDVSHLQLLPGLFFIHLEYLIERLIKGLPLVSYYYRAMQDFPKSDVTLSSSAMVKAQSFNCSGGRCVKT
jgi:hypothetical protein